MPYEFRTKSSDSTVVEKMGERDENSFRATGRSQELLAGSPANLAYSRDRRGAGETFRPKRLAGSRLDAERGQSSKPVHTHAVLLTADTDCCTACMTLGSRADSIG